MNETASEVWRARYGDSATPDAALEAFWRHRSVRRYTDQPISDALRAGMEAAAQSASTSSHLQLWSAVRVVDPELREQAAKLCGDQNQIRSAAEFYVFCADLHRVEVLGEAQPDAALDHAEALLLAVVDASLAAERMVCAAEAAGLGICYIGAARNQPIELARLLGFPGRVFAVFGLCLGFPVPDAGRIKPRRAREETFFTDRYAAPAQAEEFDRRMAEFYNQEGMEADVPWSQRSLRRMTRPYLSGRETLAESLRALGFPFR